MECIFCKIAKKEIASEIIYEDENFIAFLDIHPRSRGMTLIIPKKHLRSLEEDQDASKQLFSVAIRVVSAIKKALSPIGLSVAYLPSQIEHLHLRIYPYFENEIPLIENKPIDVSAEELKKIAEKIREKILIDNRLSEEKKMEKKEEEKSEEERFWSKRDWFIA